MSNIRNSRTTHPRKQARRAGAARRFFFDAERAKNKTTYARNKRQEADSLGLALVTA